jgi:hypothetical protein
MVRIKLSNLKYTLNINWLFLAIGAICYLLTRKSMYLNNFVVADDASQHLLWMNNLDNYFENDETIAFSSLIQPISYKSVLNTLNNLFGKSRALLIFDFIRVGLCFILCSLISKPKVDSQKQILLYLAMFTAIFSWAISFNDTNMARSYTSVFLLFFIYRELQTFKIGFLDILVLSIALVFYPPVGLILVTLYGFRFLLLLIKGNRITQIFPLTIQNGLSLVLLLISITFLYGNSISIATSQIGGNSIDKNFILNDCHVGENGRIVLLPFWKHPVESIITVFLNTISSSSLMNFAVIIFILLLFQVNNFFGKNKINLLVILSGIILYFIAIIFPFKLYIPSRYPSMVIELVAILILSNFLFFSGFNKRTRSLSYICFVFLCIISFENLKFRERNFGRDERLYEYLSLNIPKGAYIFSNGLQICNMIPYFSKRSVFVNLEMLHAVYFEKYRNIQDEKMKNWSTVLSSIKVHEVVNVFKTKGITHVLLKKPYFNVIDKKLPCPYELPKHESRALRLYLLNKEFDVFVSGRDSFRLYALKFDGK